MFLPHLVHYIVFIMNLISEFTLGLHSKHNLCKSKSEKSFTYRTVPKWSRNSKVMCGSIQCLTLPSDMYVQGRP